VAESAGAAVLVTVRYFAAAADSAGRDEETMALGDPTLAGLKAELSARYGAGMERVMRSGSFIVDTVVSRDPARAIAAAVDVLPPFAGG
jgi:sulfur-carrier protein